MKMEENEKKKKKIVKKAKRIRGIVMMTLLCVLMMSAATYAWFTLSNTAKIANLTMTVGEATGLQIAKDTGTGAGTYGSVLQFDDGTTPIYKITGKLLPATTADGKTFLKPTYNDDGEVSGTESTAESDILSNLTTSPESEGYYYETTFYLKALGNQAVNVQLKAGGDLPANGIAAVQNTATGTYVIAKNGTTDGKGYYGFQSIRISLTAGEKTIIYEPYSDIHGTNGTAATLASGVTITPATVTSQQKSDGTWNATQSKQLTLTGNADTLVTMRIWVEGTDQDCVNEISLDDLLAQIVFETVTTN